MLVNLAFVSEYVAFLKALVDKCTEVSDDSCEEIKYATFAEPASAASQSTGAPESESSTDAPIIIIDQPQLGVPKSSEEKTDEQQFRPSTLTDDDAALIAAILKESAKQGEAEPQDQRTPASSTEADKSAEFVPVLIIEPPQEIPGAKQLTPEDQDNLAGLLLGGSSENKSGQSSEKASSKSSQSSEASDNTETTSTSPEDFAEGMELLGFGGDVDTTTTTATTQAPPVMSEESEQNLIAMAKEMKPKGVEVVRVDDNSGLHYWSRMNDDALGLLLIALVVVLLVVSFTFFVARRVVSRREKIYSVY